MIRVLHIVSLMQRGGQETLLMNIYREIDRTKVQFDFVVQVKEKCAYDDEIMALGGKIYHLPAIYKNPFRRFILLRKIIKENNYQIVHRHSDKAIEWVDMAAAMLGGAKIRIYHAHNNNSRFRWIHFLCRPINNSLATHKFACSKQAGRWMFGKNFSDSKEVLIVPNGIDVEKFMFNLKTREHVRASLNLQDKYVIGHIGRFEPQKNHSFLIKVFAQIYKQKPDAVLMLVGDGPLRPEVEKQIDELGLRDAVLFLGVRSDVHELYQAMDVFVLPSLYEGFPMVTIEAQAAGVPCLISDTVTSEVNIVKTIYFLPIDEGACLWVEHILNNQSLKHKDTVDEFFHTDYNINNSVMLLLKHYCKTIESDNN